MTILPMFNIALKLNKIQNNLKKDNSNGKMLIINYGIHVISFREIISLQI